MSSGLSTHCSAEDIHANGIVVPVQVTGDLCIMSITRNEMCRNAASGARLRLSHHCRASCSSEAQTDQGRAEAHLGITCCGSTRSKTETISYVFKDSMICVSIAPGDIVCSASV